MNGEKYSGALLASGGVDSSMCAYLVAQKMQQDKADFLVVTLLLLEGDDEEKERVKRVKKLSAQLGLDCLVLDLRREFSSCVIGKFWREYALGRTPNPCADCNRTIKLGLAIEKIKPLLEDDYFIATGHYAKILAKNNKNNKKYLARAADINKDQSYFLADLPPQTIDRLLLPLGDMTKEEVREGARALNIEAKDTPESMDLCFASGDYRGLLPQSCFVPGEITDESGNVLGHHSGLGNYTQGQRKGLGIAHKKPMFVKHKDIINNKIIISEKESLMTKTITASDINILIDEYFAIEIPLKCKIRSQGAYHDCTIKDIGDNLTVECASEIFSPTSGQRVALYKEDGADYLVVAGGVIV